MKVMMVGHSSSGKTTYMAAMYGMMLGGIENYSIVSRTQKGHDNLCKLCELIIDGDYPGATDFFSEYNFYLKYNDNPILDFDWYDYRGGALLQTTDSSSEIKDLKEKIASSDALIVFLDGDKITRRDNSTVKEYRRISMYIQSAVEKIDKDSIYPISIVITKGDKFDGINIMDTPGIEIMKSSINNISINNNLQGLLTITEISSDGIVNVQYPFLFSMLFGIIKQGREIVQKYNDHVNKAKRYANKAGFFDDVMSFFMDETTYRDMAYREIDSIKESQEKIEFLLSHLDKIHSLLENEQNKSVLIF